MRYIKPTEPTEVTQTGLGVWIVGHILGLVICIGILYLLHQLKIVVYR